VRQQVWVTVLSVDVERKRIALSLKEDKGKHDRRHNESDNEAHESGEPKVK
jgi:ribosomal protein S1